MEWRKSSSIHSRGFQKHNKPNCTQTHSNSNNPSNNPTPTKPPPPPTPTPLCTRHFGNKKTFYNHNCFYSSCLSKSSSNHLSLQQLIKNFQKNLFSNPGIRNAWLQRHDLLCIPKLIITAKWLWRVVKRWMQSNNLKLSETGPSNNLWIINRLWNSVVTNSHLHNPNFCNNPKLIQTLRVHSWTRETYCLKTKISTNT